MERQIFKNKIYKLLESMTNEEVAEILSQAKDIVILKKNNLRRASWLKKEHKHFKIITMNPEEIPNIEKSFTELFCKLNKDKILEILEEMKIPE